MGSEGFDMSQLVALPGESGFEVSLRPDETIWVSASRWEDLEAEFKRWASELPEVQGGSGPSYRLLATHTGGNRLLARLLVAMGEACGVWQMHPRIDQPMFWGKSRDYPMVLCGSLVKPSAEETLRRVPKPSAGDLETDLVCASCKLPMGPSGSRYHDLVQLKGTTICDSCYNIGVDPSDVVGTRHLYEEDRRGWGTDPMKEKLAEAKQVAEEEQSPGFGRNEAAFASFLDGFK